MIVSDADIIEALQKYRGIVTSAAKQVGMTRSSLSRRIHRTKHLEEELHEIRETAVDDAEHMLFQKIEEGHVASIIFFLKCFGKESRLCGASGANEHTAQGPGGDSPAGIDPGRMEGEQPCVRAWGGLLRLLSAH